MSNSKSPTNQNEYTTAAFLTQIETARELVAMLSEHLDDHMGADPYYINWDDVGDAIRLVEALREVVGKKS